MSKSCPYQGYHMIALLGSKGASQCFPVLSNFVNCHSSLRLGLPIDWTWYLSFDCTAVSGDNLRYSKHQCYCYSLLICYFPILYLSISSSYWDTGIIHSLLCLIWHAFYFVSESVALSRAGKVWYESLNAEWHAMAVHCSGNQRCLRALRT